MKKRIQFMLPNGAKFVVVKQFNDDTHYKNYVSYMKKANGFILDEAWQVTENQ